MAKDALSAHARDELGISEITTARPVQAALTSAATFAVGAAMPLLMVVVSPANALVPVVSVASLGFLALLGAIGARAGGANVLARHGASDFLGCVGDGTNGRYRKTVRHGCVKSVFEFETERIIFTRADLATNGAAPRSSLRMGQTKLVNPGMLGAMR